MATAPFAHTRFAAAFKIVRSATSATRDQQICIDDMNITGEERKRGCDQAVQAEHRHSPKKARRSPVETKPTAEPVNRFRRTPRRSRRYHINNSGLGSSGSRSKLAPANFPFEFDCVTTRTKVVIREKQRHKYPMYRRPKSPPILRLAYGTPLIPASNEACHELHDRLYSAMYTPLSSLDFVVNTLIELIDVKAHGPNISEFPTADEDGRRTRTFALLQAALEFHPI